MFKIQTAARNSDRSIVRIPLEHIRPNPDQPRRHIPQESVAELADSIRRHGLLSPLLVRRMAEGEYELIAGERRLRALISLGRPFAEAVVMDAAGCECALIALVENLQREQLHFLDEAEAYRRILESYPITQEKLAASLSCSPSALANRLRLLKLPGEVRCIVRERGLSERHARALLRIANSGMQAELAHQAAQQHMSVKALEARIDKRLRKPEPAGRQTSPLIRDNRIVINALMDTVRELGRIGVQVKSRVEEKGDHVEVVVCIPACQRQEKPENGI